MPLTFAPRFRSLSQAAGFGFGLLIIVAVLFAAPWGAAGQNQLVTVSAANYEATVTPDSIAAAFGTGLAPTTQAAPGVPLPTSLAGTTVKVNGRDAGIFFVSAGQVNFLIPAATEIGSVTVVIRASNGATFTGTMQVRAIAPVVFTANASGQGVPAAVALRVRGTVQTFEPLSRYDTQQQRFVSVPLDLGPSTDQIFLIVYGGGVRRRGSLTDVSAKLGGVNAPVMFAGPAPGFVGVDQLNVGPLPRNLVGTGSVKLLVSVIGAASSNETDIEIAQPCGGSGVQITSLSATNLLAGQELIITGANFSATAAENSVRVIGDDTQPEAQILEAAATRLRVLVPFGAGSGRVSVNSRLGTGCFSPITMRTSISGFVQDGNRQAIRGVTVRYLEANLAVQTNAEGAFIVPDAPVAAASATIEIDGTTVPGGLPYPKPRFKIRVRAGRDNQFNGYIELKQITGPSLVVGSGFTGEQSLSTIAEWAAAASAPDGQIQTGQVILDVPNNATVRFPNGSTSGVLTLTVLESGRTPGTLPSGQFSPVIAQITPFGATISPGAKLTFPNPDGYAPNTRLKLFRFDQRPTVNGQPNPTLGQFIEVGTDAATVSADGQRIESTVNAVTETSYYFVSGVRTTVTLIGRVVENNLNRTPVRRSLVNARGQGIFTDGNGGFVIRNVPVNASAAAVAQLGGEITLEPGATEVVIAEDRVGVEADFMRPSTKVDRSQQENVPPVVNTVTVTPDLVLNSNRPPVITAPASTTANAGTAKDVGFLVSDPDAGQTVQVTVEGASFATVIKGSGDNFTLRLSPGANDGGNYNLVLTATDGRGGTATKEVKLRVNGPGPIANEQVVSVSRNTAKAVTLTGSDPQRRTLTFILTSFPTHGTLTGTPPNITYTPARDYTGTDSFSFKVRVGQAESDEAAVTLNIQQQNIAPTLTVPGNQSTNGGETLKFTVTANDPDTGQTLRFDVIGKPNGATVIENQTNLQFSWTPTFLQSGSYEVTFKVSDSGTPSLSDTKRVTIIVEAKTAQTSGPEGGAILSLTSANGMLYAGTDGGGIFRSTDNGQSWVTANSGLMAGFVSVRSFLAAGVSVFVGTGAGIYRSTDNGQNWTRASDGLSDNALKIHALLSLGSNVFAWTDGGFYRSTNNGQSWVAVGGSLPQNTKTLLAANNAIYAGTEGDGVYRTGDNGQNWTRISNGLSGNALKVRTLQALGNTLLAGTSGDEVYRTTDGGQSWVKISNGLSGIAATVNVLLSVGNSIFAGTSGGGVYNTTDNGQLWRRVSSGLPSTALDVSTLVATGNSIYASAADDGIYQSVDGGQSWRRSDAGIAASNVSSLATDGTRLYAIADRQLSHTGNNGMSWTRENGVSKSQVGVFTLLALSSGIYAGTNGDGVYRTTDNGQNWTRLSNGLPGGALTVRSLAALGSAIFAGTGDEGVYRTIDGGLNWLRVSNGLSGESLNIRTLVAIDNNIYAGTYGAGVYRSTDNGQNWTRVSNGLVGQALNVNVLLAYGNNIFAGTDGGGIYRSNSGVQSWVEVNNGIFLSLDRYVRAITAIGNIIYAGTLDGSILQSTDVGQTWAIAIKILPGFIPGAPSRHVFSLLATNNGIFAGTDNGVYIGGSLARNGLTGLSWNVNTMLATGGTIFIGTDEGVYRTPDNGASWVITSNGFPNERIPFNTLVVFGGHVFAGSNGNGVYRSSDNGKNWVPVNNGITSLDAVGIEDAGLNITKLLRAGNFLFATTARGGLYRTADNGNSWERAATSIFEIAHVDDLIAVNNFLFAGGNYGVYRSIDNGLHWTPVNNGLIKQNGLEEWVDKLVAKGGKIFARTSGGLYSTIDNGGSWAKVNIGPSQAYGIVVLANSIFTSADGEIYQSIDDGQSWKPSGAGLANLINSSYISHGGKLFSGSNGKGVSVISDADQSWTEINSKLTNKWANAIAATGNNLFTGTTGSGVFRSTDQGQTWSLASANLPPSANIQSVIANGTSVWAASFGDGVYRSTNQGTSWMPVNTNLTNKSVNRLFLNGTTLYAGTEGGVYRSTNNGDNWALISTGMGTLPVDSFAALGGTVYAGTDGSGVYRLNGDGVSWTRKSNGLTSQQVRSLGVNGNLLYAGTIGGGICLSRDGGETWTAVNNQLPPTLNVFAFAVSGRKVYAGSIYGVFLTEDEGRNWKQLNAGLLNTYVTGLAVGGEQLFAATASGGVFVSRIPQ